MELPLIDEGLALVTVAAQSASRGPRGQRRASRATARWHRAPPLPAPHLPVDMAREHPDELFGKVVFVAIVQGAVGRAARPLVQGADCLARFYVYLYCYC